MPDLIQSLQQKDPGFIQIITGLWEIDLKAEAGRGQPGVEPVALLAQAMLTPGRLAGLLESLPEAARQAIAALQRSKGKLTWQAFTRRFGVVREMGAGRRDREQPYLQPDSTAEVLWYHGLIGRAFLDTPSGPQEFAYLPTDLLERLPDARPSAPLPGRPAHLAEQAVQLLACDHVLDHACTLLAALRLGLGLESQEFRRASWDLSVPTSISTAALQALLSASELLNSDGTPHPELSKHFLELPRNKALALLARSWMHSRSFNELRLLPGLRCEGEWSNDALQARYTLLEYLQRVSDRTWWSLDSFVAYIKDIRPDYQRPAGDYDSWYIRSLASDEYLRGFSNWERVDGALIRFLVEGPLYWLGFVDVASPAPGEPVSAFRISAWASALLAGAPPSGLDEEQESMLISSDGRLRAPRLVPRHLRYQVSRFCSWESASGGVYAYRVVPGSLERARAQGLRTGQLLSLLRRASLSVPPNLPKALDRWETYGIEARLERLLVLRLRTPDMLQALRNSRYGRFLGEPLGPTSVIVKPGAWKRVQTALAELGFFGEESIGEE